MAVSGIKGTITPITLNSDLYQKAYDKKLYNLWPDGSFETLVNKFPMRTVYQPEYKHVEDNARFRTSDTLAAQLNDGDVEMTVTDGTKFIADDIWLLNDGTNTEWIRVSGAPSGTTVPITRNIDAGGAHTFATAKKLIWLGPANADGGDRPSSTATEVDRLSNYVQKFRLSFALTSWQQIADMEYGKEQTRLDDNKFIEYNEAIAKACLFGVKYRAQINGKLVQTSAGILSQISTNNVICGTTAGFNAAITEKMMLAFFEIAGAGPSGIRRFAVTAGWLLNSINYYPHIQQQTRAGDTKYGFNLKQWVTPDQTYDIMKHHLLDNYGSTNKYDLYGAHMVIIPDGHVKNVGLGPEGKHNFTVKNRADGDEGTHDIVGEHWTTRGFEVINESLFSTLSGITSVTA